MFKLRSLFIILMLAASRVAAQSPKELLMAIQKSKPDTNRVNLQIQLGSYYLYKPGEYKNDLDSAIHFFNQALQLSDRLHSAGWHFQTIKLIANYYAEAGDFVHSKQYFMQAIAYYHQKGDLSTEADTWAWLADMEANDHQKDSQQDRVGYYQHAQSLFLQKHLIKQADTVLVNILDIRLADINYRPDENELQHILALYKTLGYKNIQNVYLQFYELEFAKGNCYRALDYCLQGIKNMQLTGDTAYARQLYLAAAKCNYSTNKYDDARKWVARGMASDKKTGLYTYVYQSLLVQIFIGLNRDQEARQVLDDILKTKHTFNVADKQNFYLLNARYYDKINNNEQALQYFNKALDIHKKQDPAGKFYNLWPLICNNEIAGIYLKMKQPLKAKKYLDHSVLLLKISGTNARPLYLVDFYSNLYQYDEAAGKYRDAVKNLEQRDRLRDSLFTVDKDNKIAELNIHYETAQKEQAIKDLHNQAIVERVTVKNANLQRNVTAGGIVVMILVSGLFYRNYKLKQKANNTILHKNDLLQHLLTEKEWLLKEVHHRVKNNLHTVICLLESQSHNLENDALKAIENSRHRIYAMSLIHQKLYQSDDIKTIDMASYIPELVESLKEGFGTSGQILFKLNIDKINLPISHAIPLGLIVNEAVTNSIKYAFPGDRKGEISIFMIAERALIKLELADNGVGMRQIGRDDQPESLGLRLMKGLSEDIDADITFKVENGTRISIIFKPDALNEPENILTPSKIKEGLYA